MGKNSAIEWTNHTLNFWQGCHPVSEGCENCYMYRDKKRYGQDPTKVIRSSDNTFFQARKWKDPAKVFVCSWSDFFIKEADEWRPEAWEEIRHAKHLTMIILTKRPENIMDRLPKDWGNGWPNVWLGVTAENQQMADERIPILLQIPAAVRFVSAEPMLGPVELSYYLPKNPKKDCPEDILPYYNSHGINWVICGGESGPGARPMHPDWARNLRDQCQDADVPFFFKQWGKWLPVDWRHTSLKAGDIWMWPDGSMHTVLGKEMPANITGVQLMRRVGKKKAGRIMDGRTWDEFPEI